MVAVNEPGGPAADAGGAPTRRRRQPERTRASILAAATEEFARHGLAGARVDRIAERAGANKRMLYQYFGSKAGLWLKVLEGAYEGRRGAEAELGLEAVPPEEGMRRFVRFNVRYCREHPEMIQLFNSENLHGARHLKQSEHVRRLHGPLLERLGGLLERGVAAGVFRPGVDRLQLYVSIAALGYFYHANIHTLSTVFAADLSAPAMEAAREAHAVDMVLGYLRP